MTDYHKLRDMLEEICDPDTDQARLAITFLVDMLEETVQVTMREGNLVRWEEVLPQNSEG